MTPSPKQRPEQPKPAPKPKGGGKKRAPHLYLVGYATEGRTQCVYGNPVNVPVSFTHRMTLNQAKRYAAKEMRSPDVPVAIFELVPVITGYARKGVFSPLTP